MPDETNDDYSKIFGQGGAADAPAEDETLSFDPSEAIHVGGLPEDDYFAVVSEKPEKKISQNGNPMMYVTFAVTDGPFEGQLQWKRFMLKGKGGGWTKQFLEAIGLDEEAAGTKPIAPTSVYGRHCIISVRDQKDNKGFQEVWQTKPHPKGPFGADGPSPSEPF